MLAFLNSLVPDNHKQRKWIAVGITVVIAGVLTLWGIQGIGKYGMALFVLTPIYIGLGPTVVCGMKGDISRADAMRLGVLSLAVFTVGLLVFAIEGLICIIMAAPIGMVLTLVGSIAGHAIVRRARPTATMAMFVVMVWIPVTATVESVDTPEMLSVTTSIEIKADRERVWEHVVQFPRLAQPTELMFNAGIAYPIGARIEGSGVGAVRYCTFTTGDFVEPITVYDAPGLLAFDVVEQPAPMVELSLWKVDAPHLHGFFVSRRGQFKLTELPNGNTLLEGTTWYHHRISPAFYWRLWSDHIVHAIHTRVLQHIKRHAEKSAVTR